MTDMLYPETFTLNNALYFSAKGYYFIHKNGHIYYEKDQQVKLELNSLYGKFVNKGGDTSCSNYMI